MSKALLLSLVFVLPLSTLVAGRRASTMSEALFLVSVPVSVSIPVSRIVDSAREAWIALWIALSGEHLRRIVDSMRSH